MRNRIDKLVEMALDFSSFGREEPDVELHQVLGGERVVIYTAIHPSLFWKALQDGVELKVAEKGQRPSGYNTFYYENDAVHAARVMVGAGANGMVLVSELPIQKLHQKGDDIYTDVAVAAGAIKRPVLPSHLKPNQIVGVLYPADEDDWDHPIRAFIKMAKAGEFEPEIPASGATRPKRLGTATPEAWQHAVLRYVMELLNYSTNYSDYLTGDYQYELYPAVLREASKIGLGAMLHWTGQDFMNWLYKILPPLRDDPISPEEDSEGVMKGSPYAQYRFYQIMKKFVENHTYEIRTGRKPRPQKQNQGHGY